MLTDAKDAFRITDVSGPIDDKPDIWQPLLVPRAAIDERIAMLCEGPTPESGRRAAAIIHPQSLEPGPGFAPGTDVTINVLMPGEETAPMRRNANEINICLSGEGVVRSGDVVLRPRQYGVWNLPSMQFHSYRNNSSEPFVRLTYSNAPLLRKLGIHYIENGLPNTMPDTGAPPAHALQSYTRGSAPSFPIADSDALLLGYEALVDIEVVRNNAMLWPWEDVRDHLSTVEGDGKRTILLLYNPATERRMGTSHSYFATMSSVPGKMPLPPRGHRHGSASINYHFRGSGESVVDGERIEWRAGDLLLSAPAWSEHSHGVSEEGACVLTVQDHPLHIAMESLIWQERMLGPILALGAEEGVTGYSGPREVGS